MSEIHVNKIKLIPNKKQEAFFELSSRASIFCYNWALYQNSRAYSMRCAWLKYWGSLSTKNKNGKINHKELPDNCKFISNYDLTKRLAFLIKNVESFKWLEETPATARNIAVENADTAWRNYFSGKSKRGKDENDGKPNRKKYREDNYAYYGAICTPSYPKQKPASFVNNKKIKLAKIGWVKMTRPLYYDGFISSVTISKLNDGWYAAISVKDSKIRHTRKDIKKCGIDLGLKDLATIYDGVDCKKHNIRDISDIGEKIKSLDKKIGHKYDYANRGKKKNDKKFYSKTRKKLLYKKRVLSKKMTDIKEYDLHNLSTGIILNHKKVVVEDLDVCSLKAQTSKMDATNKTKRSVNKKYDDQNLGKFKVMLDYKSKLYGSDLIKADKYFASSKICSNCGVKNTNLTIDIRKWVCESCNTSHDRDENAAKNLFKI